MGAHLGSEDKADSRRRTEDDEQCDDNKRRVRSITNEQRDWDAGSARDDDVVDAQADILGVVERSDTHITRLPRQETPKHLPRRRPSHSHSAVLIILLYFISPSRGNIKTKRTEQTVCPCPSVTLTFL